MTQLTNSSVLITGGASGIGLLLAQALGKRHAKMVLWDINAEGLDAAKHALESNGVEVATFVCDLSSKTSITQAAKATLSEVGHVDVVVNNAGIVSGKPFLELSDGDIERTFAVNTLALFRVTQAFLPQMIARGSGHVVTIASAGGLVGTAKLTDYCASKFAAIGFDESLRMEMKYYQYPVRTTVVCPYYIDTGMFAGVKTRFPFLLPILKPEAVVGRVTQAILKNKARVVMPWFTFTTWPTRLLPVSWFDALMDFFGVTKSMDEFKGRNK